jgi:hypothetical protein
MGQKPYQRRICIQTLKNKKIIFTNLKTIVMLKRIITIIIIVFLCSASYAGKVKLYLGARVGMGTILTRDIYTNDQGLVHILQHYNTWSLHAKGEALLGVGRFRIGYQFLYNFSGPQIDAAGGYFPGDNNRNTTYFNSSQTHYFGHYLLMELAIINRPHFALTPGVGVGSYNGFKVDNTTGNIVQLSTDTHNRFSISAELNAEIKFGRCVFLIGPNYYLFSAQDRADNNWREYQHFIGVDAGFRVNILK